MQIIQQNELIQQIIHSNHKIKSLPENFIGYSEYLELECDLSLNNNETEQKLSLNYEFNSQDLRWVEKFEHIQILVLKSYSNTQFLQLPRQIRELEVYNKYLIDLSQMNTESLLEKILICSSQDSKSNDYSQLIMCDFNQMKKLQHIEFRNMDYVDLANISKVISLKVLVLSNIDLIESPLLSQLSSLTDLSMKNCNMYDILCLKFLHELVNLDLSRNHISNLYPLKKLLKLKKLILHDNQIDSMNAMSKLSQLTELDLSVNLISDVKLMRHFTSLKVLNVSNNLMKNIDCFQHLTKLQDLNISFNQVCCLKCLRNMHFLQTFSAHNNMISDISDLINCKQLKTVTLQNNQISDILDLVHLKSLIYLDISTNNIVNCQVFPNLVHLIANSNKIASTDFIISSEKLQWLELKSNHIARFPECANLTHLDLEDNRIIHLEAPNSTKLKYLNIKHNFIIETDLSAYEHFKEWIGIQQQTLNENYNQQNERLTEKLNKQSNNELNENEIQQLQNNIQQNDQKRKERINTVLKQNYNDYFLNKYEFKTESEISNEPYLRDLNFIKSTHCSNLNITNCPGMLFVNAPLQITNLCVTKCKLNSINGLKLLLNLKILNLKHNKLVDVTEIRFLHELESLNLQNNKILTIDPIIHLTKLKFAYLDGNCIQNEQFQRVTNTQYSNRDQRALTTEEKRTYKGIHAVQQAQTRLELMQHKIHKFKQKAKNQLHFQTSFNILESLVIQIAQTYQQLADVDYSQYQ
ncbi:leucine-rich_repeat protein [Hexamita inflata]|uniref:Leucine-rich_repeat protein n=1 Tax=Hexamita inflata TaxID=28002 RepID=A0ABP1I2V2_9EUKA